MYRSLLYALLFSIPFCFINEAESTPFRFGAYMDPYFNFKEGRITVDYEISFKFGSNPSVELIPVIPGYTVERNITENLDFLLDRGFTFVSMGAVEGSGEFYFDTPLLRNIVHEGFDYDSQCLDPTDRESDLVPGLSELEAKLRYAFAGNFIPFFAAEAHKRGMDFDINFESLGHIINLAEGEGIGADPDEMPCAENLPPLSPDQISQFLEELKAAVTTADPTITSFSVFEEAFSDEYVAVISETTRRLGITHRHTGACPQGWGDTWEGYYYSFYPLSPLQLEIYWFLISIAATPPVEALTFGAARAMGKQSELVVGHYTPWPADPTLSIEDLYDPERFDLEMWLLPIDPGDPRDRNGNPVATRTADLQKNYFLYALIAEHLTDFLFSVDLGPAFEALAQTDLTEEILPRLNEFAYVLDERRPIVNVIIDQAVDQGNDALTADNEISDFSQDMWEVLYLSLSEPIFAAIAAAGFEAWVTFDAPLEGREVDAYWIITAGGGEEMEWAEEGGSESPPLWSNADDLDQALMNLIDPTKSDKPVIISTMAGLPNLGNWAKVREIFGIPTGRGGTENAPAYACTNLIDDPDCWTSLATNILTDSQGDTLSTENWWPMTMDVLPETINWDGYEVRLHGFDPSRFGVFVNVISPEEVPQENILLASSRADKSDLLIINDPDDAGENVVTTYEKSVYIFRDRTNGKKILINPNTYHLDMIYPLSSILCDITGQPRTMNKPSTAYIASGKTAAVFAVDNTSIDLNLPIEGDMVLYNKFDRAGNRVETNKLVSKADLFPLALNAHELAVIAAPRPTKIQEWRIRH